MLSEKKKAVPHLKKLCIEFNWKVIMYYEHLPQNQTLNSDMCYPNLDRLIAAIDDKCPNLANRKGVVLYQDNTYSVQFAILT